MADRIFTNMRSGFDFIRNRKYDERPQIKLIKIKLFIF